jgi:hypothetical protein
MISKTSVEFTQKAKMYNIRPLLRKSAVVSGFGRVRPQRPVPWPAVTFSSASQTRFWASGLQDPVEEDSKDKSDANWKSTAFKMFETAGATMASIAILGYIQPLCNTRLAIRTNQS